MFCTHCGSEIVNGNAFCGNCGSPVGNGRILEKDVFQDTQNQWQMHCPRCGNNKLQVQANNRITSSVSLGRQVGRRRAIAGTSYNNVRETYWLCPNCGMQFRDLDELLALINQYNSCRKIGKIITIITIIIFVFLLIVSPYLSALVAIPFAVGVGMWIGGALVVKIRRREYNNLLPKVRGK